MNWSCLYVDEHDYDYTDENGIGGDDNDDRKSNGPICILMGMMNDDDYNDEDGDDNDDRK